MTEPNLTSVHSPHRPVDDDHALLCGQVAGSLALDLLRPGPLKTETVEIVDDEEGNHLDAVRVTRPSGAYLITIKREDVLAAQATSEQLTQVLFSSFGRYEEQHHDRGRSCPGCGVDLMTTAITHLAYVYDVCACGTPDYAHLIEQLWHRDCLADQPPTDGSTT
jgi:hypothetical protein